MKTSCRAFGVLTVALAVSFFPAAADNSATAAAPAAPSVADGYKSPTVTVPYAYKKPTIDGVIHDDEWQGAESTNALQTNTHAVSPRQSRFWMMWDEDNLYVAMRSPLRDGERIVQNIREGKDPNVVFDDSYEIWLDVDSKSPDGQPVFFQFQCNYAGIRLDVMHEPAVGNRRTGWSSNWKPANRITPDGKAWEMEVVIPRASICLDKPFADGGTFRGLLARNFKKPWEQNSFEGIGSFSVREMYTKFTLSKTAPAIHLLRVADPAAQTFGLELSAFGNDDRELAWTFESDGGVKQSGTLEVRKGRLTMARGAGLDFDKPDKTGSFRIKVASPDGKTTYLDWAAQRKFGDLKSLVLGAADAGDRVPLSVSLNPEKDYVRVRGDFIDFDNRKNIDHCELTVADSAGKELARKSLKLDELAYVRDTVLLKDLPSGQYTVKLSVIGAGGKDLLPAIEKQIVKKDPKEFPWWHTKAGSMKKVLPPWTPVKAFFNRMEVWGRKMDVGAAGLPERISSQDIELLASPARLEATLADGKRLVSAGGGGTGDGSAGWGAGVCSGCNLGDNIQVVGQVNVEYDGMYKVEMTLTPKTPVKVKSLKMIVPLKEEVAEYVYGKGEGIRSGFYMGFLPKDKKGRVWDCLTVDSQPMVVGSFIPYVWVGNSKVGLCWFADSDEGWNPDDKTPAIEIRRDGASVDMVFNFISAPAVLDKPRKIVFAFEASPAKPMHKGWRMDTWWCGDTFNNYAYPDGKGSLIWESLPFTTAPDACKKMVDARHTPIRWSSGGKEYPRFAVPYIEYNTMGPAAADVAYFGEAWKTSAGPLYYGSGLQDYVMYNLAKWRDQCGIDGWYLDNVRPVQCDNIEAGRGYRLPDGRIQPAYSMFAHREYFLRLRSVFTEGGRTSKIVNHMTNNMILPWNGAVDVAYDGEEHVIYPEMGKDFMDFWSLERLRMDCPDTWGVVVNFMHEYQGNWTREKLAKAMRAYIGAVILHDALPTGNGNGYERQVMSARDRFGIDADDVKFIAYWDKDARIVCPTKGVYLAAWLRQKKVLIAVVNWGEKTNAKVKLDLAKLGLADPCHAYDAQRPTDDKGKEIDVDAPVEISADGAMTIPVDRHDYKLIVVNTKQEGGNP